MRVEFLFSKRKEFEKLLNIYSEYQWFIDNDFPIILPTFYNGLYLQAKNDKSDFEKKLKEKLETIYNKSFYQKQEEITKNKWQEIEDEFFKILKNLKLKIQEVYFCHISLYGPEGQYEYPNIINIRVSNDNDIKEINTNIAHEIIHLIMFDKIQNNKLGYKQTEGVIDLFFTETELKKIFPNYKLQNIAIHSKKIFRELLK